MHPAPQEQKRRPQEQIFPGSPSSWRRETRQRCRRNIHMLSFTYEDEIKIKSKHVSGIPRTFHLPIETLSRPPQSRETVHLMPNT
jgi:hypothetical protein